jgi:hypothetical protein
MAAVRKCRPSPACLTESLRGIASADSAGAVKTKRVEMAAPLGGHFCCGDAQPRDCPGRRTRGRGVVRRRLETDLMRRMGRRGEIFDLANDSAETARIRPLLDSANCAGAICGGSGRLEASGVPIRPGAAAPNHPSDGSANRARTSIPPGGGDATRP